MNGLHLNFPEPKANFLNANCLIGVNGSGKSQFLETIAEIFLYLDNIYRKIDRVTVPSPPLYFEIEYSITLKGVIYNVLVIQEKKKGKLPEFKIFNQRNKEIEVKSQDFENYLPQKIIGYTSGENETLSIPFHAYYDVYATYTANRARKREGAGEKDYTPRFYFMDYSTNLGIVISNLVFEKSQGIDALKKQLKIEKLKSFQIILQTKQSNGPKITGPNGEKGILLTDELKKWREFFIKSATCYDYDAKQDKYTFDFYLNDATRNAFTHFFKSSYNLYSALYKFELLNNLIVDATTRKSIKRDRIDRRLNIKMPSVPNKDKVLHYSELKLVLTNSQVIDYLSLSDGEHQFFNIFGTIILIDHDNSLFLLDEPETHFNPQWRRSFISHLRKLTKSRKQDFFLTSHSPFIVSDSRKESIFIFERASKDKIEVKYPQQETFGASFDNILQLAFGIPDGMSEDGANKIKALKLQDDPKKIEKGLTELGESAQLLPLYRRIEMLKPKKRK
jgi:restriction system-associated AAA family ATPase